MNPPLHLSDLDRRILAEVQRDATLSTAELARRTHSSAATCWRRLRALEEAGVLGPAVRQVEATAVGLQLEAFCNLRLTSQSATTRAAFQRLVDAEPAILAAYSISGEWDYLVHLIARDMEDFETTLMRRLLDHESVGGTATLFVMRRLKSAAPLPV